MNLYWHWYFFFQIRKPRRNPWQPRTCEPKPFEPVESYEYEVMEADTVSERLISGFFEPNIPPNSVIWSIEDEWDEILMGRKPYKRLTKPYVQWWCANYRIEIT